MSSGLRLVTVARAAPAFVEPATVQRQTPATELMRGRNDAFGADPAISPGHITMTSSRLLPLRRRLSELALAGLVLALLGASYGAFAVVALRSARSGDGAFQAADFYEAGANPWEQQRESQPPLGRRLALVGPQGSATP